jgi:hypothetical protein
VVLLRYELVAINNLSGVFLQPACQQLVRRPIPNRTESPLQIIVSLAMLVSPLHNSHAP